MRQRDTYDDIPAWLPVAALGVAVMAILVVGGAIYGAAKLFGAW